MVKRLKVSVFLKRYFTDPASRPHKNTLINHIRQGLLSGEQVGCVWYVLCNDWDQPIKYSKEPEPATIRKIETGNTIADNILARL